MPDFAENGGDFDIDADALAAEAVAELEKVENKKKAKEESDIRTVTVSSTIGKNFSDSGDNYRLDDNCIPLRPNASEDFTVRYAVSGVSFKNARAVGVLEKLKSENRGPTADEQSVLSGFVGWSGLNSAGPDFPVGCAFNGLNDFLHAENFSSEKRRALFDSLSVKLKDAVSKGVSRCDDFSTSNEIIDQIYSKLRDFGFSGGVILDPCCGSGRFFGRLPDDMKNSEVVGVEIDETSSEIASRLYPGAEIINSAIQDVSFNNRFDVVLGNIPSQASESASEEAAEISQFLGRKDVSIGEQFLAKSVMSARPGGIVALAVGSEIMDNPALVSTRETVAKHAEFLGALRLPDNAAGMVDRPTDIIFLKKRETAVELNPHQYPDQSWVSTVSVTTADFSAVTSYADDHTILPNGKRILLGGKSDLGFMVFTDAQMLREKSRATFDENKTSFEMVPKISRFEPDKWLWRNKEDGSLRLQKGILDDFNRESVEINSYFNANPDMVLGDFVVKKYDHGGVRLAVEHVADVGELTLKIAAGMSAISGSYSPEWNEQIRTGDVRMGGHSEIKTSSFCMIDGELMFRRSETEFEPLEREENKKYSAVEIEKIKGYVGIRDSLQKMIELESIGAGQEKILEARIDLNARYDEFFEKFGDDTEGAINSGKGDKGKPNRTLFAGDASWSLVSSIENFEKREVQKGAETKVEKVFAGKMPIMLQDVIAPAGIADEADSFEEGLKKSLFKKARVDIEYIAKCLGRTAEETEKNLVDSEMIFRDPLQAKSSDRYSGYVLRDEFLSGDVGEKLRACRAAGTAYEKSAEALEAILPAPIPAEQITITMGAGWLPEKFYKEFFTEEAGEEWSYKTDKLDQIGISKHSIDGVVWKVSAKYSKKEWERNSNRGNRIGKYSTRQKFAGDILAALLNQDTPIVTKTVNGKSVVDNQETQEAQTKANLLAKDFREWLLRVPERRKEVETLYNNALCGLVKREWKGEWIPDNLPGMNSTIRLHQHQRIAVERQVLGGNSLIVHGTGAGKTFSMIAGIMEKKRLGIANKTILTVPNQLIGQIAGDFMRLYPGAKIKVATEKNYSAENRQNFLEEVRQGDYDCVIMGHSQFKLIPVGKDVKREEYIDKLLAVQKEIAAFNQTSGKTELTDTDKEIRKNLLAEQKTALNELKKNESENDAPGLTFERLGVDNLVVDEAHEFKNLTVRSRDGEGKTGNSKTKDMYMKTRWLNVATKERGVTFSTATPVSNHISELWVMQKYTQPSLLEKKGLGSFDEWAHLFCQRGTNLEVDITGQLKEKTRFVRYVNLPELKNVLSQVADIKLDKTEELKLDLPTVHRHSVEIKPSEAQKAYMGYLIERAKTLEEEYVDSHLDNSLMLANEGRRLALDERLVKKDLDVRISKLTDMFVEEGDGFPVAKAKAARAVANSFPGGKIPEFGESADSKVNVCSENVWKIYDETTKAGEKATQLIFLDNSVANYQDPNAFTVYAEMKKKLVEKGIPEKEIAFIHDTEYTETGTKKTDKDKEKEELFAKVRNGEIRILLGSTSKLGTGVNVQNKLRALHHLDPTWKASEMEQRDGRGYRPGNEYKNLDIYSYSAKGTMDGYMYQALVRKADMVSRLLANTGARTQEDDFATEQTVSYRELCAIGSGKEELIEIAKLKQEILVEEIGQKNFEKNKEGIRKRLEKYPEQIARERNLAAPISELVEIRDAHKFTKDGGKDGLPPFSIAIRNDEAGKFENISVKNKAEASLSAQAAKLPANINSGCALKIGEYRGFTMTMHNAELFVSNEKTDQKGQGELLDAYGGTLKKMQVVRLLKPKTAGQSSFEYVEVVLGKSGNLDKIDNALEKTLDAKLSVFTTKINRLLSDESKDKAEMEKPYEGVRRLSDLKKQYDLLQAKLDEKVAAEKAAQEAQEQEAQEQERENECSADNSQNNAQVAEQNSQQTPSSPSDKTDKKQKPQSRDDGLSR